MVFFAIWWAWVNYSWFASAYDTDDIVFRLLTFVVMTGVLVARRRGAARRRGPATSGSLVVGYVIMRLAMVPLWLRVAREHPAAVVRRSGTPSAIAVIQVALDPAHGLLGHDAIGWASFVVLAARGDGRARTGPSTPGRARRGTGTTSPSATSCSRSSCSAR